MMRLAAHSPHDYFPYIALHVVFKCSFITSTKQDGGISAELMVDNQ